MMGGVKDPWFVVERSEALAALVLTARPGLVVVSQRKVEEGIDFYVGLAGPNGPPTQLFVVQVKGTLSANPTDWARTVRQLFQAAGGGHYLPTCVFVVNVRTNVAQFAWIAEPTAGPNCATLRIHHDPAFHELTDEAVTEIIGQVKSYYAAMPMQLQPAG